MGPKMKSFSGLFISCAVGALLLGFGPGVTGAMAADADLPVKAVPLVAEDTPWWTHGFFEVGGRTFLNNPQYGGSDALNQKSLAKF